MMWSVSNAIAPGNHNGRSGRFPAEPRLPRTGVTAVLAVFPMPLVLMVFFLFFTGSPAAAIERSDRILRIHGGFYPKEDFFRISEFFTGRENLGGRLIRRSNPDYREGYYIALRFRVFPYRQEVEEAVRLDIIPPGFTEAETYWFSLGPGERNSPEILIGLTGPDWPDPDAHPLAWRIAFYDSKGEELAWAKSYLWGKNEPPDEEP